ncbi:MAG TPA: enoyl-CoA hydratase/isomerase family protein [Thermoleophilaceae bacterium]|nr:enoyl-CoA hydratase/isomerase family protein [Thermoleophilaceae bacterium]
MSDVVGYSRDGDVGHLVIDKPPLNLFDRELVDGLKEGVAAAAADSPRALLVRAEGKVFTGGVDVHEFDDLGGPAAKEFASELLDLTHSVEDLPFPTLAAVHKLCLTAGLELALACDLIWAGESAQFGLVERVVGVTPFMGGTQRMAERAGPARAREFVYSGNPYPAAELERWGVVNRVVADDELQGSALEFATHLAVGPPHAHAATKRIVRVQVDGGTRAADEVTPGEAERLFETGDLKRAVKTFLAEGPGKATFTGD